MQSTFAHFKPVKRARGLLIAVAIVNLCLLSIISRAQTPVGDCSQDGLLAALALDSVVIFNQDCSITLTSSIPIDSDMTIDAQGHQVIISANNQSRVFEVAPGVNFTSFGLTIVGGQNTNGGALYIDSSAVVVLSNCTFTGNSAIGTNGAAGANGANNASGDGANGISGTAGTAAYGGAVFNLGDLTLLNCTLGTNSATGGHGGAGGNGGNGSGITFAYGGNGGNGGAGALARGGAIYNLGTLLLSNCTFSGNTATGGDAGAGGGGGSGVFPGRPGSGGAGAAGSGAGIYSTQTISVESCTFSDNTALGGNSAAGGTSSIGDGDNGARGGDSFGGGISSFGQAGLTNCTFFNDKATGGSGGAGGPGSGTLAYGGTGGNGGNGTGGGLYSTGSVDVVNCTFSSCSAGGGTNGLGGTGRFPGSDGSKGAGHGGNIANGAGTFNLMNSILATNLSGANAFGTIADGGYNISSDATPISLSSTNKNKDPKIGPLANNGGPTKTMALLTNSPAIDKIPPSDAPATDQRGVLRPRPTGGLSDIGAYEYDVVGPPFIVQQPTNQSVSASSPATFSVMAVGAPILKYQWRFNSSNIAGATRSSYTIAHAFPTNQGNYDVVITNGSGSVTSDAASLTVRSSPSITIQPANQTVPPGSNATFTVGASGDQPLFYQWQFYGTNIPGATSSGGSSASYTITNAQANKAGPYDVVITNSMGAITSSNALLRVAVAPALTQSRFVTNSFAFMFNSETNVTYLVQYKTNLTDPTWITLLTTNGTGVPITFRDATASGRTRFYRVRVQ